MADWFKRFDELARASKTEEEFLAAAEAMVRAMPAQLLTRENLARIAEPLEGAIGAAILNTVQERLQNAERRPQNP